MKKLGRPPITWNEIETRARKICEIVSETGASRKKACIDLRLAPSTVDDWLDKVPEFAVLYARAEERRADYWFEVLLERANNIKNAPDALVARVQIDTIKWACCKLLPRKYGDRLDLNANVNIDIAISDRLASARRRVSSNSPPMLEASVDKEKA
jgi:hypothetical protein